MSANLFLAFLAATVPSTLAAQAVVQPLGFTDADRLASQMRVLAANPRDLNALATAGELSLRVGDLSGAAALFARADRVDPRSGRVKAGMAAILVRSERPGESLRFFAQAESYGWPALRFAADRGLAYDLIGQQERAQRDYRLALRNASEDETVRRYGLSLGISGRQKEALEQLDPLVRRQDRAAWRARAFVLAMGGDTTGAAKIATAMMPTTMAQGLGAFFVRLPALSPVDRAFAVHFGEVFATPERIADARLTPFLPPLTPEPSVAPVQVAAAVPPRDRRSRRERERDERDRAAALARARVASTLTRPPVVVASARPVSPPPAQVSTAPRSAPANPAPTREPDVRVAAPPRPVPVATAPVSRPVVVAAAPPVTSPVPVASASAPAPVRTAVPSAALAGLAATPAAPAPVGTAFAPSDTAARVDAPSSAPPAATSILPGPAAPPVVTAAPATTTPVAIAAYGPPAPIPAATPAPVAGPPAPVVPVETAAATERTDSVLARIVASLSIPAAELGIAPVRAPVRLDPAPVPIPAAALRAPASSVGRRVVAEASAKEARDATVRRTVAARLTGDAEADEPLGPRARRAAAAKALAEKKAAEEKKALAAAEAEERRIARTKPARIWVQVAGGASASDLPRAWRAAQAKAPALKDRAGYSTPSRATNRVLTGPFKTEAEARALINQLARQGVSAFSFTSERGQDVKALGGK